MRRTLNIILLLILVAFCANLWAKQAANGRKQGKKIYIPPVYLGNSDYSGGPISKNVFDSLLKQGLNSRDSLGNTYKIVGFDFSYAERNLYEDSAANLVVLTDFSSEYCTGNMIPDNPADSAENTASYYHRTKAGDTAYFIHIMLSVNPGNTLFSFSDTVGILGRDMKFEIVK